MTFQSGTENDELDRHIARWSRDVAELSHLLFQKRGGLWDLGNIHKMAQSNDDKLAQAVGAKLRQIREGHALSTGDLAARSGIAEKNIIEFEGGKSRPDGDQVIRLSQALNVVPSAFFSE